MYGYLPQPPIPDGDDTSRPQRRFELGIITMTEQAADAIYAAGCLSNDYLAAHTSSDVDGQASHVRSVFELAGQQLEIVTDLTREPTRTHIRIV